MSSKSFNKTEIVYKRLKEEYKKYANWDEFAEEFGVSRQALNKRRKKESLPYDEIKKIFPHVNRDWLNSEDEIELKSLPVKQKFTNEVNTNGEFRSQIPVNEPKVARAADVALSKGEKISQDEMKRFLAQIESLARILKDSL